MDARSSNIGRLVQHFKALVKKGMSEDAAFQMVKLRLVTARSKTITRSISRARGGT